ncbi:major histocompatibility complex class I-related gene protein-like isoform X2 [Girardinichthys multiradiatus]|uniref:major histocompatibility complex class I-related gene protein-like isoform X2 n=1 Tax=Girardinichthys multiradiatus TaxID=208333 RepID=UPI001FACB774|nr:major histocompatibility complex class I-related gene protein-like isoform X2 [Girardinichthys multiradiatus]
MRRVDPREILMRTLQLNLRRWRRYSVPAPNSLWHIDGNHELIRTSGDDRLVHPNAAQLTLEPELNVYYNVLWTQKHSSGQFITVTTQVTMKLFCLLVFLGLKRAASGVHIYQAMYGCQWDDETGYIHGYEQYGYDGEDFILFDLNTKKWIAPKPQAFITKHKWDYNRALVEQTKGYLTQVCPEWLKKYVNYGRRSLMRTDLPSVSLLQKTSSSTVSCHATGFYPNKAEMFWRKDGEEVHDGVDKGEILPNNDETFQMSVNVDLSSETSENWMKYECVFQLSGVNEDIIVKLEKTKIRTNSGDSVNRAN